MSEGRYLPVLRAEQQSDEKTAYELHQAHDVPRDVSWSLGKKAAESFTMLQAVESPYKQVREQLEQRIIGQPAAIDAVITALEKSCARLPSDNRPIANLALLGPTGTGKTETARTLAELLGEEEEANLIKIDCSAYTHGHEVALLTGSPPGYVGHELTPTFNPESIEKPGTVVLFDEVEKGALELRDLMLQIMDDGALTLSKGEKVSFRNAIVIMTSNLGAAEMTKELSGAKLGFGHHSDTTINSSQVDSVAKHNFKKRLRPEFVNRLDEMVVFQPLDKAALLEVLDVKIEKLTREYEDAYEARLTLSDSAREHLADVASQEPENGARPLVRALEKQVQAVFGRYVGAGYIESGTHVHVRHKNELSKDEAAGIDTTLAFAARHDPSLLRDEVIELPMGRHAAS